MFPVEKKADWPPDQGAGKCKGFRPPNKSGDSVLKMREKLSNQDYLPMNLGC